MFIEIKTQLNIGTVRLCILAALVQIQLYKKSMITFVLEKFVEIMKLNTYIFELFYPILPSLSFGKSSSVLIYKKLIILGQRRYFSSINNQRKLSKAVQLSENQTAYLEP